MAAILRSGLTVAAVVLALAGGARADDPTAALGRKDLDRRLSDSLRDVINVGATIYNNGDQEGCYRLYEGALTTAVPLLDHRPALKTAAERKLAAARRLSNVEDRAFALRAVIDDIRSAIRKDLAGPPSGTTPSPAPPPTAVPAAPVSLWDRLGGEKGVRAIVKELLKVAAADPKVNFSRNGKYKLDDRAIAALEQKIVELISQYSAPQDKALRYTGNPNMKEVHAGMGITADEFDAFTADLVGVLKKLNVPDKDGVELVGIVGSKNMKRLIVEEKPKPAAATPKSLWDRLGGEAAVRAVVKDVIKAASADPKVNFDRGGKYKLDAAALEQKLVEFVSSATGGPLKYTGKDMKTVHTGMGISGPEFNALAGHLTDALKQHKVPDAEANELMNLVAGTKKDIVEK